MAASAVEITGLTETRALLARFEPDLLKRLDSRVGMVARDLKAGAQGNFARTGAGGNAYAIRTRSRVGGFSKAVTTAKGSVARGQKWSTEPGVLARVFEFADGVRDAQPQNRDRVRSLIATLNARYGTTGRFLWEAWDQREGSALASINAVVKQTEAEYSRRLL